MSAHAAAKRPMQVSGRAKKKALPRSQTTPDFTIAPTPRTARKATIEDETVRELRALTAVCFRTGGSFFFKPINEKDEMAENTRMAIQAAQTALGAVPHEPTDANTTNLDGTTAAEKTVEALKTLHGGVRYPWQEPPLYKAVLEARRDELREVGLSDRDGTLEEWNALVGVLDASCRSETTRVSTIQSSNTLAPRVAAATRKWGWRHRHKKPTVTANDNGTAAKASSLQPPPRPTNPATNLMARATCTTNASNVAIHAPLNMSTDGRSGKQGSTLMDKMKATGTRGTPAASPAPSALLQRKQTQHQNAQTTSPMQVAHTTRQQPLSPEVFDTYIDTSVTNNAQHRTTHHATPTNASSTTPVGARSDVYHHQFNNNSSHKASSQPHNNATPRQRHVADLMIKNGWMDAAPGHTAINIDQAPLTPSPAVLSPVSGLRAASRVVPSASPLSAGSLSVSPAVVGRTSLRSGLSVSPRSVGGLLSVSPRSVGGLGSRAGSHYTLESLPSPDRDTMWETTMSHGAGARIEEAKGAANEGDGARNLNGVNTCASAAGGGGGGGQNGSSAPLQQQANVHVNVSISSDATDVTDGTDHSSSSGSSGLAEPDVVRRPYSAGDRRRAGTARRDGMRHLVMTSAFRRTSTAPSVRESVARLVSTTERADNLTEDRQLFRHIGTALDKLSQLETQIDRVITAATQYIDLRMLVRVYTSWHVMESYQSELKDALQACKLVPSNIAGHSHEAIRTLITLELAHVKRSLRHLTNFRSRHPPPHSPPSNTSSPGALPSERRANRSHPMAQLYTAVRSRCDADADSRRPISVGSVCTDDFNSVNNDGVGIGWMAPDKEWQGDHDWLEDTRQAAVSTLRACRNRLLGERIRLSVSGKAAPRQDHTQHWRELVFGVKGAIASSQDVDTEITGILGRVRTRFSLCFARSLRCQPHLHSNPDQPPPHQRDVEVPVPRHVLDDTLDVSLQTAHRLWDVCCQMDTDEVARRWDARYTTLNLSMELNAKEEQLELLKLVVENQRLATHHSESESNSSDTTPAGSSDDSSDHPTPADATSATSSHVRRQEEILRMAFKKKILHTSKSMKRQHVLKQTLESRQQHVRAISDSYAQSRDVWQDVLSARVDGQQAAGMGCPSIRDCAFAEYDLSPDAYPDSDDELTHLESWGMGAQWCGLPPGLLLAHTFTVISILRRAAWLESAARLPTELGSQIFKWLPQGAPPCVVDGTYALWCRGDMELHPSPVLRTLVATVTDGPAAVGDNRDKTGSNGDAFEAVRSSISSRLVRFQSAVDLSSRL
eukprot:m.129366 g.129366  ORF g.129366 m.129366 type:complete len:1292 (+) comp11260_c0_seq1:744-4619(+)